ncbi:hypothetical protein TYRP_018269 [Tyrophagus putrescentiae]|nr:hypothetical protein TYRP_018269 [Tyrophagus putrescentiae]
MSQKNSCSDSICKRTRSQGSVDEFDSQPPTQPKPNSSFNYSTNKRRSPRFQTEPQFSGTSNDADKLNDTLRTLTLAESSSAKSSSDFSSNSSSDDDWDTNDYPDVIESQRENQLLIKTLLESQLDSDSGEDTDFYGYESDLEASSQQSKKLCSRQLCTSPKNEQQNSSDINSWYELCSSDTNKKSNIQKFDFIEPDNAEKFKEPGSKIGKPLD